MEQMTNTSDGRPERIAAGLEDAFENCTGLVKDWLADGYKDRTLLRPLTDLMKTGAQIAGAISRLESLSTPSRENRGSIPQ
jgi:hypothetical protein